MKSLRNSILMLRAAVAPLARIALPALLAAVVVAGCSHEEGTVRPHRSDGTQGPTSGEPIDEREARGTLVVSVRTDSLPVADAQVEVYDEDPGVPLYSGRTGSSGLALFDLDPGSYTVRLSVPAGFEPAPGQQNPLTGVLVEESDSTLVGFLLVGAGVPPGDGAIEVRVSSGLEPRADVEIRVLESGASQPLATGTTGPEGSVLFTLSPGIYEVELVAPEGWELWPGQVNPVPDIRVWGGDTQQVSFLIREIGAPLPQGTLVVFASADSLPVADAVVEVLRDGTLAPVTASTTNESGHAAFDLEAGAYAVRIEPPEGYVLSAGHPNPQSGILVLPAETTWLGFFLLREVPADRGEIEVEVRVNDVPTGEIGVVIQGEPPEETIYRGATGAWGLWTLPLPAGSYRVTVEIPEGMTLAPDQANPVTGLWVETGGRTRVGFELVGRDIPVVNDSTLVASPQRR